MNHPHSPPNVAWEDESDGATRYELDLSRYQQAVEAQQRLMLLAQDASERLAAVNDTVKQIEAELGEALEMAKAAVRTRAKAVMNGDREGERQPH